MTPKQEQRMVLLEQFAHVEVVQLKKDAEALGMPTRFLKALDEMKEYAEFAQRSLTRDATPVGQ